MSWMNKKRRKGKLKMAERGRQEEEGKRRRKAHARASFNCRCRESVLTVPSSLVIGTPCFELLSGIPMPLSAVRVDKVVGAAST